jgi:hypothetical protein
MGIVTPICHVLAKLAHKKKDELQKCKFYTFGVTASRAWMKRYGTLFRPQVASYCLARVDEARLVETLPQAGTGNVNPINATGKFNQVVETLPQAGTLLPRARG